MSGAWATIDLKKIEANARAIASLCRDRGIEVTGVTKATGGMPQVAKAMLRGGVGSIGESRLENIERLRASGISCPVMLLRIPPLTSVEEVVAAADISLNSELTVIQALSDAAERHALVHKIIIMVDLGDLREGVWAEELVPLVEKTLELPGVSIVGIGTNLTCYGGVLPSEKNLGALVDHADTLERRFDLKLQYISGGNSSSLPLLAAGRMPAEINHLRIGEAILLGRETVNRSAWPGTYQDAFLLGSELIELKEKPSVPTGETGEDAFGHKPEFADKGPRDRGIVNIGRVDLDVEGVHPVDPGIAVLGASSDHLLLDVTDAETPLALGDTVSFEMNYSALVTAMTSPYVQRIPLRGASVPIKAVGVSVIGASDVLGLAEGAGLSTGLAGLGYKVECDTLPALEDLEQMVEVALGRQQLPLVVGRNHRASAATLHALADSLEAFGLIWLDETPSFMPPRDAGEDAGTRSVLSRTLGYNAAQDNLTARLSPENVVLVGLRTVDPAEAELITESPVKAFTMEDVDALGIREVMRQGIRAAGTGTEGVLVCFNPAVMETRHDARGTGGLTYREGCQVMEMLASSGLLRAMALIGLRSDWGQAFVSETVNFVLTCFGKRILGR
jgi:predicted amino acid racemase/arginase family enzyme